MISCSKFAGAGLDRCSNKLNEASQKWGDAIDEINGLRTAINRGAGGAKTPATEPWAPDGVESKTFYDKLDSIALAITQAAKSTWEGLGMTGVFMGHVAKIAGTVSLCTAALIAGLVTSPVTMPLLLMDSEGKALELTQKLEKYVRDNIDQATQDIIASEFVSSISSGLTACAVAMKNVFAPVNALLDGIKGHETAQHTMTAFKAVGNALTYCGVFAGHIIKHGFTKDALDMVLKGMEAVYNGIKESLASEWIEGIKQDRDPQARAAQEELAQQTKEAYDQAIPRGIVDQTGIEEYSQYERVGEGIVKAFEGAKEALQQAYKWFGSNAWIEGIKQDRDPQARAAQEELAQQTKEAYAKDMGSEIKEQRAQQRANAIDEATQIFTKLRDAGAISQEEMNQYVKSFVPREPAKSSKDLVNSVASDVTSTFNAMGSLAHGVVTIGHATEVQVSQATQDLAAQATDCKAVDDAMSKAANDNNITADTLIGATVKACATEEVQQAKEGAAASIDQDTLKEAAAGLASAVGEVGQISSLNQAAAVW